MARGDDDLGGGETFIQIPAATVARLERLATASLLATGLAHEIANPLAALVVAHDGIAEGVRALNKLRNLDKGPSDADVDRLAADLDMASVCASSMMALVRDFQFFLRPDENTPVPIPNEVRPAVERAIQMARARLCAAASLSVTIADTPPVGMPASRITQIILNLLLNAADALADVPPRGHSNANSIELRVFTRGGQPVIEVQDNGPGLSAEMRTALFEPGRTTKRQGSSLGLGLAISRQLARASGGDITTEPAPQRGSIFRLTLVSRV
jgi:two-component system cell cycle sensor histidine kinase/response regulator CckA